jgi:gamma-glutamyltranspeptidase/glutathione hydrolase
MAEMLEGTGYERRGGGSAASSHYIAEVMRRYFADRARYLGDGDFVKLPLPGLLDPAYIARRRATIDPDGATPSESIQAGSPAGAESLETTHFNVIDAEGNAVALTYTINNSYGSGVTVPGLGFLLNNEMDDFAAAPGVPNLYGLVQGEANEVGPGKRMLSSMTPVVAWHDGEVLAVGSPGGSRIPTAVAQVLLDLVVDGAPLQRAVDRPRVHHQWLPDVVRAEEDALAPETAAELKRRGHRLELVARLGEVCAVRWLGGGGVEAAADPRGPGSAGVVVPAPGSHGGATAPSSSPAHPK